MIPLEQYIQTVLFILCVVLTFKAVDEILLCAIRMELPQRFFHMVIYSSFDKKKLNFLSILLGVKKLKLCAQPPFFVLE